MRQSDKLTTSTLSALTGWYTVDMKKALHDTAVWSLSTTATLKEYRSSPKGLSSKEVEKRTATHGPNRLTPPKVIRPHHIFFRQFKSPLVFVLLAAALLTGILHEWLDTVFIILAVLVNVSLGFYQEYRAENTIEKLSSYIKQRIQVVRDGRDQEIDAEALVPGDIIHLAYGVRVPADARILEETSLATEEAILTGESLPIAKQTSVLSEGVPSTDRTNMVFGGTLVVEGYGQAVVTATGSQTEIGKIAQLVATVDQEKTPLQHSLWNLAWVIFFGVLFIVAALFFLGMHRGEPALEMLVVAIAVAVGAIPEALPIVLTVILAVGAERLAAAGGVIRNLAAAETLGSATVILVDKTGTLTKADMQLASVHATTEITNTKPRTTKQRELAIVEAACLASNVTIENPDAAVSDWHTSGSAVEVGIVKGVATDYPRIFQSWQAHTPHYLLPFSSVHKFSVTKHPQNASAIVMGAPDILLKRSTMSKQAYVEAERWLETMSTAGNRLIAVGTIQTKKDVLEIPSDDVQEIEFLGVLAFQDPLREDTADAVAHIEQSGARVIMITGDLKGTAVAIGRQLGWEIHDENVLTGNELQTLDNDSLIPHLPKLKIFARMTPSDKLRVAHLLQRQGEVVAMTGDGVNDAPSLRAVAIGVALGSGSDVAKSAADLVLLNDTFATIVAAISEGRRILSNIRKSFVYLMSNSLDEVILISGALLFALPLPLTALQIIWVNLFTGSIPALALAFDTNDDTSGPRNKYDDHAVFTTEVKVLTIGVGILTSILLFILYAGLLAVGIETEIARSLLFISFASYILVAAYSFRSLRQPLFTFPTFNNTYLNVSVLVSGILIITTVTVPFMQSLFSVTTPPLSLLWIVGVWLVASIALVEGAKFITYRYLTTRTT